MKNLCRFLLAATLITALPQYAQAGIDSGGGDSAEAEFVNIGRGVAAALRAGKVDLGIDLNAYEQVVTTTTVSMVRESLFLDGQERDAINYPCEKKIIVNRNHWIPLAPVLKVQLAFHEFLGIAGLEHNGYPISSQLVTALGREKLNEIAATAAPELNYHCELFYKNRVGLVFYSCGTADFSTKQSKPAHCGKGCERMIMGVTQELFFPASVGYPTPMQGTSIILGKNPKKDNHSWIPQSARAGAVIDIYSAPLTFQINLALTEGGLFKKRQEYYYAVCERK